jgi:hypothetical protein
MTPVGTRFYLGTWRPGDWRLRTHAPDYQCAARIVLPSKHHPDHAPSAFLIVLLFLLFVLSLP